MNPAPSLLQQQYPLSRRKFWKKMYGQVSGWWALLVIGFIVSCVASFAAHMDVSGDQNSNILQMVIWGAFAVGTIFVLIITAIYAWYTKKYISTYFYAGEEHFITIKKGVFSPAEIHVQWQKIQDVYVDQDIIDRMMGLYDVHIASATAASGMEAHIDGVDQQSAEGLKKFLLDKVSNAGRGIFANNAPGSNVAEGAPQAQQAAPVARQTTYSFPEEISSDVYPLAGSWFIIKLIGRIFSTLVVLLFLGLGIFGETLKTGSGHSDGSGIIFIVYFGIAALSAVGHIIGLFLWKKNYAFKFNPDNIYYREGMISMSEKHMPYSSIQDVTVQQGVLERFVGLATVRVENATQQVIIGRNGSVSAFGGILLQGLTIADANKIAGIVKETVLSRNSSGYGL